MTSYLTYSSPHKKSLANEKKKKKEGKIRVTTIHVNLHYSHLNLGLNLIPFKFLHGVISDIDLWSWCKELCHQVDKY